MRCRGGSDWLRLTPTSFALRRHLLRDSPALFSRKESSQHLRWRNSSHAGWYMEAREAAFSTLAPLLEIREDPRQRRGLSKTSLCLHSGLQRRPWRSACARAWPSHCAAPPGSEVRPAAQCLDLRVHRKDAEYRSASMCQREGLVPRLEDRWPASTSDRSGFLRNGGRAVEATRGGRAGAVTACQAAVEL